jgi:hypothetical protein
MKRKTVQHRDESPYKKIKNTLGTMYYENIEKDNRKGFKTIDILSMSSLPCDYIHHCTKSCNLKMSLSKEIRARSARNWTIMCQQCFAGFTSSELTTVTSESQQLAVGKIQLYY